MRLQDTYLLLTFSSTLALLSRLGIKCSRTDVQPTVLQEYMESIGLPFTTLYLHGFLENFFKFPSAFFMKGPGGNYFWSNNSGDQPTHWHSNKATGTAVLGMSSVICTLSGPTTPVVDGVCAH